MNAGNHAGGHGQGRGRAPPQTGAGGAGEAPAGAGGGGLIHVRGAGEQTRRLRAMKSRYFVGAPMSVFRSQVSKWNICGLTLKRKRCWQLANALPGFQLLVN